MTTQPKPSAGAVTDAQVRDAIAALVATESDPTLYASLTDRSARARVRSAIEARVASTIGDADPTDPEAAMQALVEARRLKGILDGLAAHKSTASRTPRDPAEVIADRIATLRLAADLLADGMAAPDGMEPVLFGGNERDLVGHVSYGAAMALATAKVTRQSPSHDTEEAFRAAFADQPVGTFLKVSEIRKAWVAAGGPDKSDGRITARLFAPKGCTVSWIEPVPATATTKAGARLSAPVPTDD